MARQIEGLTSDIDLLMGSDDEPWDETSPKPWSYIRGMKDGLLWAGGLLQNGQAGNEHGLTRFSLLEGGEASDGNGRALFDSPRPVAELIGRMLDDLDEDTPIPAYPVVTYEKGHCEECGWPPWLHPTTADFPDSEPGNVHTFKPLAEPKKVPVRVNASDA